MGIDEEGGDEGKFGEFGEFGPGKGGVDEGTLQSWLFFHQGLV